MQKQNLQAVNHASGLAKALRKKAALLSQQAEDLDADKDGGSRFAANLRKQAEDCLRKAEDLDNAIALSLFLGE